MAVQLPSAIAGRSSAFWASLATCRIAFAPSATVEKKGAAQQRFADRLEQHDQVDVFRGPRPPYSSGMCTQVQPSSVAICSQTFLS